jgi:hypothetical protein
MQLSFMRIGAGIFALAALNACGSDTTSPTVNAGGHYSAVTFITTGGSGQTNQLLNGSTVTLDLNSDGTTGGHLHVAATGSDPAFDADMAGTWRQDGMIVTISQPADTFIRDMPFTLAVDAADGWDLVGDKGFAGTRIQLTLKRSTAL